jgi:ribose transport system substrate-binding protein
MRRAYLALAVAACFVVNGCAPKVSYKYRIAVIPKGLTHVFWESIHRGADRAAADLQARGLSVQILWDGPTREDEAQPQIDIVNQAIGRNVNGIVLAPQHSETMIDVVRKASREKIPVVIIDSGLKDQEPIVKYIATNNYHGGELAAQHLLKVLREQDKKEAPRLVLFRYKSGSESTEERERGFKDTIDKVRRQQEKAGKPAIQWISNDQELGATRDEAERSARPILSKNVDKIDGIFTPNESTTSGVVQVLRSIKPKNKIRLVGFDSSEPLLQALRGGEVDGLIVQDPYRMGYLGVWTLVQHLEGVDVTPKGVKYLSTGENLITRDNLDRESTRMLFDEQAQAKRVVELPDFLKGTR